MTSQRPERPELGEDSHTILMYKVMAPLSWVLLVTVGLYHTVRAPQDTPRGHRIFQQANKPTPFTQSGLLTGLYLATLLLTQLNYLYHLYFSRKPCITSAARSVSTHFALNNLFLFSWVILWTHDQFAASAVFLVASYLNQHAVYVHHERLPAFVHLAVVAGPFAWAFTGLFWNIALVVEVAGDANALPVRVLGNVAIWIIVVVGSGMVVNTSDYLLGYCLAWLTLSLAIKQFFIKVIALQWIFAFVVFAVFLVESLYLGGARFYGRDSLLRRVREPEAEEHDHVNENGQDVEANPHSYNTGTGTGQEREREPLLGSRDGS